MSENTPPTKTMFLKRRTKAEKVVICLLLALVLTLTTLPYGLKVGLSHWLHKAGVAKAEIEDVDFNPFLGRLALKSVRLSNQEFVGLKAAEMAVTFKWWPLLRGRFKVTNLEIDDGSFALRHLPSGKWRIGGIPLDTPTAANDSVNPVVTTDAFWDFGADNISIKNMVVSFHEWHWQDEITIVNARFENLATWEKDGVGDFMVRINKGPGTLDFAGKIKPFATQATLEAAIKLERFPLSVFTPLLAEDSAEKLDGSVDGDLAIQATYGQALKTLQYQSEEQFAVNLAGTVSVSSLALDLVSPSYHLQTDHLSLQGEASFSRPSKDGNSLAANYQANGSIQSLQILDPGKSMTFLRAAKVELASLQGGKDKLTVQKLQANKVAWLQRKKAKELSKDQQEYIVAADDVILENIELLKQGFVSIGKLGIQDSECLLVRNSQGKMEFAHWQSAQSGKTPAPDKATGGGIRIGSVTLTGNNRVDFEDHFLNELYKETFDSLTLETGVMDSRAPQLPTPITLHSKIGRYASLNMAGTVSPFATATTMDLTGTLRSLELPPLNPYADQYLFYRLESGQLDADITIKVEEGVMNSEAALLIEKLKIKRVKEGKDPFQQLTGFSFQYAVDLLRDKKDNIRVRLPIKGDIQSLDFQFGDVVTKALVAAVKKATLSYYAPIGVTLLTGVTLPVGSLYVSGKVIDWATAIRFKPVNFASNSAELSEDNRQYLDQVVTLLSDRPKVRVVLCGKATIAELVRDQGTLATLPEEKTVDISPPEQMQLLELAGSRARKVKEYLVIQGVEAKRLILCDPGVDNNGKGGPRVEISI